MLTTTQNNVPNLQASINQYYKRGGFVNGLNPTITGKIWYVNGNTVTDAAEHRGPVGSDSNSGLSPLSPFLTMARAFEFVNNYDIIVLDGVIREQLTTPDNGTEYIHDVTIIGGGNKPRQATSGGVANGGGATWLSPTSLSNTLALLKICGQGWTIQNIYFNNAATTAACIQIFRDAETLEADGSHAVIDSCIFTGTDDGINVMGGPNYCNIDNNFFLNFAETGDTAISYTVGVGAGTLNAFNIRNNMFLNNVNHIVVPFTNANIYGNNFSYIGRTVTTTLQVVLTSGQHNLVWENKFGMATNTAGMTAMFGAGSTDSWGPNHFSNAVQYGDPLTTGS